MPKKVVLDTNVTISAMFWKGYPREIYENIKKGKVILLSSIEIEKELIRVLSYEKFGLTPFEILPIINDFRKHAVLIEIKSTIKIILEDSTDNIFLNCAIDGDADYIISGDKHLLNLKRYKNIEIVKSKDFLLKEGLA